MRRLKGCLLLIFLRPMQRQDEIAVKGNRFSVLKEAGCAVLATTGFASATV